MHAGVNLDDDASVGLGPVVDLQLLKLPFAEPVPQQQVAAMVTRGETDKLEEVLCRPQDPDLRDANGRTLLQQAARQVYVDAMKLLLEAGADKDSVNNNGWSALHLLAEAGSMLMGLPSVSKGMKNAKAEALRLLLLEFC